MPVMGYSSQAISPYQAMHLGHHQRQMLRFCQKYPSRHTISPDWLSVKVARSLERKGLLHVTDCGMAAASGQPVLIVSLVESQP
jgi:hypothetical protein